MKWVIINRGANSPPLYFSKMRDGKILRIPVTSIDYKKAKVFNSNESAMEVKRTLGYGWKVVKKSEALAEEVLEK